MSGITLSSSKHRAIFGFLVFAISLAAFVHAAMSRNSLSAGPENGGDSDSYERLGFNLAAGSGFGYCPSDQPILTGAAEPVLVEECEAGCSNAEFQTTAYRPPGFPFVIAAVYRFSPLNFAAIRILNCIFCALAVCLVSLVIAQRFSFTAGLGAAVLCSIDPRFREFAGTFLTENLATLTLCLFAVSLAMLFEQQTFRNGLLCGLSLSLLVFVRSFYVAWYPIIWLLVAGTLWRTARRGDLPMFRATRIALVFGLASLALTGPWWIRNCIALNAIMPTGTQGGIGIADGFSDSAYANFGSWTSQTADAIAADMRRDPSMQNLSQIEFEKEHCRRGAASASAWIKQHPHLLLRLSWWKFSRLWEFGSVLHGALFGTCFVGLWFGRRHPICRVLILLLILNSITVVATYHTYERFLTPFRPLIHGFVAFGLQSMTILAFRKRSIGSADDVSP